MSNSYLSIDKALTKIVVDATLSSLHGGEIKLTVPLNFDG